MLRGTASSHVMSASQASTQSMGWVNAQTSTQSMGWVDAASAIDQHAPEFLAQHKELA
jgi:hypothetical protein